MENEPQQNGPILQSSDDKTSTYLPPLQPAPAPTPQKPSKSKGNLAAIGGILVTLLIVGAVRLATTVIFTDKGDGSVSDQAKLFISDEERKEYTSAEHGFKVNFPGFPVIERETIDIENYKIPYVLYSRSIKNDSESYFVFVYDYSLLPVKADELSLEGSLNGIIQNTEGAKLNSSKVTTYQGLGAVEGNMTAPIEGKNYQGYVRLIQRDKKFYGLMTYGTSAIDFNSFADSLVLQ